MKIIIVIAILLNIYGVLSSADESNILEHPDHHDEHQNDDLHHEPHDDDHHHEPHNDEHHHEHHDAESVQEISVDELADVLLHLPGSMGRQAYKTFISLGRFLPVETKAHKFFIEIPKAIERKSKGEMPELLRPQPSALSANPIFMAQPAGYRMMPLPLHPLFSSSPLGIFTRVPCTHTKLIRVPLHTFDVQVTSVTHRIGSSLNPLDGFQGFGDDDDDDDDDNDYEGNVVNEEILNKLLDMFEASNSKDQNEEVMQSPNQEEGEITQSPTQEGDEITESPKPEEDEVKESQKPEDEATPPPAQQDEIVESPKPEEAENEVVQSPNQEDVTPTPTLEEEITQTPTQQEEGVMELPKQPEEEVVTEKKEESATEKETQEQQSAESTDVETPQVKKVKKSKSKKGKTVKTESTVDASNEDEIKPVGRKPRRRRANPQPQD